jgi:EpsI family protein
MSTIPRAIPVNLYIAYYNSQRKGEAVHSPRSCLPGGGWQMEDFGQRTLGGPRRRANRCASTAR